MTDKSIAEVEPAEQAPPGFDSSVFSFGPFKLFPARRLLERSGEAVKLGGRAFDILVLLVNRASEVVAQREIHATVWSGLIVEEGSLRFHVSALRKALGDGQPDIKYVVNVPGRGYCFVAPVEHMQAHRPSSRPALQLVRGARHNLPPALSRMVGRDETVREIGTKLLAERFVTIVGPGGMGKTTVAVALGHTILDDAIAAVQFVDLGKVREPAQVAAALAVALGLPVRSADAVPGIIEVLKNQHMLLILDSCEHVLDAVAPIAERIFAQSPRTHILATTREPLGIEGEHVYRLPPLRMPPEGVAMTAAEMAEYSAPQLFLERARAGGAQIELTDADVGAVIEICRKLDGMALAIELAAGRVQAYGVHKTVELIGQQFSLLWPGRRTALPRHQTLTATLDWSYSLLSPAERRLLARLSVFIGAFDLEAVKAVAVGDGEAAERGTRVDVSALVLKSLAIAEAAGTEAQYRLLDTTRTYALQKLSESGELQAAFHRHARHYERTLLEHSRIEQATGEWPRALAGSLPDIRAAMNWTMSTQGDNALGVRLAAYSASLWLGLGLLLECRDRMTWAVEQLQAVEVSTEEEILIQMALGAAVMFTVGIGEEFRISWTRVLSLSEKLGDSRRQLIAYLTLWAQQIRAANLEQAVELAQRCAAVAESTARAGPKSMASWMLGLSKHHLGRYQEAQRHLEEALATDDEHDRSLQIRRFGYDRRSDGFAVLSNVLLMQGNAAEALETSAISVAEARQLDYPIPLCVALTWHGFNLYLVGADWTEIDRHAQSLAEFAQRHGMESYQGFGVCLQALSGNPHVSAEEVEAAVAEGIKLLSRGQYTPFNTLFRAETALILAQTGLQVQADHLLAAIEVEERNTDHWCRPEIERIKGELVLIHGRHEEAERLLQAAIEWAARHGALAWQLRAANSLASLRVSQGRGGEVGRLLSPLIARFQGSVVSRDLLAARDLVQGIKPRRAGG